MKKRRIPAVGLIETMRYEDGRIFLFGEHVRRLTAGCRAFGLRPPSGRVVRAAIRVLMRRSPLKRSRLRMAWSYRDGALRLAVTSYPLTALPVRGYRVMVERRRKVRPSRWSAHKTTRREFYEELYGRARHAGYDEAFFGNSRGQLVEGTRTNVFCVLDGRLVTPSLASGCLPGVTRRAVLRLARAARIPVRETKLAWDDLRRSDEIFVTNAVIGVVPVRRLDRCTMPQPCPGPVTRRLRAAYRKEVETKAAPV
ncbi:MAG: aminotransferase class IV [Deltaproteobacteria bacterium]